MLIAYAQEYVACLANYKIFMYKVLALLRTDFTYLKCEDAFIETNGIWNRICLMLISDTQGVQECNENLIQRKCE